MTVSALTSRKRLKAEKSTAYQQKHSEPLFEGSGVSMLQAYVMVFHYALKHHLSSKAFSELLLLLKVYYLQAMQCQDGCIYSSFSLLTLYTRKPIGPHSAEDERYANIGTVLCNIPAYLERLSYVTCLCKSRSCLICTPLMSS